MLPSRRHDEICPMSGRPVDLCRRLTNGVYVIGAAGNGRVNAFTAAWLTQVSFEPLLLALSVNPQAASYPLLTASQCFAVSVLRHDQLELARHFGTVSGRDADKLAGVPWHAGRLGAPILDQAIAWLECRITATSEAGDHRLIVARVVDGAVLTEDAAPLRYDETGNIDGSAALYPLKL
jgi:flavin reductase (DIM6/NTAB) family NADH-FMN oxidoreductase RutF